MAADPECRAEHRVQAVLAHGLDATARADLPVRAVQVEQQTDFSETDRLPRALDKAVQGEDRVPGADRAAQQAVEAHSVAASTRRHFARPRAEICRNSSISFRPYRCRI